VSKLLTDCPPCHSGVSLCCGVVTGIASICPGGLVHAPLAGVELDRPPSTLPWYAYLWNADGCRRGAYSKAAPYKRHRTVPSGSFT
jgi:hypothetical protein